MDLRGGLEARKFKRYPKIRLGRASKVYARKEFKNVLQPLQKIVKQYKISLEKQR